MKRTLIERIKKHHHKIKVMDIKANIEILEKGGVQAKIHSFFCGWYPFRGSVDEHIKFLRDEIWR